MLSNVDISFHPSWWHKHAGINFDEGFFFDAPRRVEFEFRLKDAEMIDEMNRILTQMEATGIH